MEFSKIVIDHFMNPRNMGEIENPSTKAAVSDETCGDQLWLYLDIEENKIKEAKFKALGCGAFVATCSIVTELIKDKTLDEANQLSAEQITLALGGLPEEKAHCARLLTDVVKGAIENFERK